MQLERVISQIKNITDLLGGIETIGLSYCIDGLNSSCLGTVFNKVQKTENFVQKLQNVSSNLMRLYGLVSQFHYFFVS